MKEYEGLQSLVRDLWIPPRRMRSLLRPEEIILFRTGRRAKASLQSVWFHTLMGGGGGSRETRDKHAVDMFYKSITFWETLNPKP